MMLSITERKVDKEALILLIVHNLGSIVRVFTKIFLTIYFLEVTKDISKVALFYVTYYAVQTFAFYVLGRQIKCSSRMAPYRVGMFLNFAFLLLIMLLKDNVSQYICYLAVLHGVAGAFYWLPYNILSFDLNAYSNRSLYLSYEKATGDIIGIVIPILIGSIIQFNSYQPVFIIVLTFTALAFLISFKISNCGMSTKPIDMAGFFSLMKKSGERDVFKTYRSEFLRGLNYYGALEVIIPIIIFLSFSSKFTLGALSSVFAFVSILTSIIVGKFLKDKYFKSFLVISGIILFGGTILLVLNVSKPVVIIYNLVFAVAIPILTILQSVYSYNAIDKSELIEYRVEHFIVREFILNVARILSFMILFVIGLMGSSLGIVRVALVILSFSILLISAQTRKFQSL